MNDAPGGRTIRFYFSFRSPYAWLAAERLEAELGDLGVPIERIPIFPTPDVFPNDPAALPDKIAYTVRDVIRLARERGLTVRFPPAADPDWALSHAAFLGARGRGGEHRFLLQVFRKRFCEGLDLGEEGVLADAAREAGLDGGAILAAARSEALRAEAAAGWRRGAERDRIFGVPSFVYAGRLYWGQDRMHFLRSAVLRDSEASRSPDAPRSRARSDVDVRALVAGDEALLEAAAADVFDDPVRPELAKEFLADPRHHLVVALEGDRVVGFASGVHYVHPDKPAELFVNEVGVAPTHRRRGIASRLLAALLARGRAAGCREAWVATEPDNAAARALYASVGGREEAPSVVYTFSTEGPR